eukprot:COSAG05_NODE_297_length_11939_cov_17.362753_1_plen_169_part_00
MVDVGRLGVTWQLASFANDLLAHEELHEQERTALTDNIAELQQQLEASEEQQHAQMMQVCATWTSTTPPCRPLLLPLPLLLLRFKPSATTGTSCTHAFSAVFVPAVIVCLVSVCCRSHPAPIRPRRGSRLLPRRRRLHLADGCPPSVAGCSPVVHRLTPTQEQAVGQE